MLVLVVAVLLGAGGEAEADPGARFVQLKQSVRRDPPPPKITRGLHYINSDERRHDLFRDAIADRGGLLIGVGSGQNYVLAGWAKPTAMVVVDFDQVIIDIHRLFEVAFHNADTPAAFRAAWYPVNRARTLGWIKAAFDKPAERKMMRELFIEYRDNVNRGITWTRERLGAQDQKTYLDDPEQYTFVKRLVTEGRVLAVRGDFTGKRTLTDIATLARDLGLEISTLYLSNIEQYFPWDRGSYRDNMIALPLTEETVVLRTYGVGEARAIDHNYRYFLQSGTNFQAWMRSSAANSVRDLMKAAKQTDTPGCYRVGITPEQRPKKQRLKKLQRAPVEDGGRELAAAIPAEP